MVLGANGGPPSHGAPAGRLGHRRPRGRPAACTAAGRTGGLAVGPGGRWGDGALAARSWRSAREDPLSIGKIKPLFTPSRPLLPLVPAPRPPALAHAWPARGPPAGPFPLPAASTLSPTPCHLQ